MNDENLVRQALELQASRAPDPDRIRAALPSVAARHRHHRRIGAVAMTAAAVAVGAAITVPSLAFQRGDGTTVSPGAAPSASQSAPASPTMTTSSQPAAGPMTASPVALSYHPTWLPAGYTERSRSVPLGAGAGAGGMAGPVRMWRKAPLGSDLDPAGQRIELYVFRSDKPEDYLSGDETVDVAGRQGRYSMDGGGARGKSYLSWPVDDKTVLSVSEHETQLTRQDLVRIAESVRPDDVAFTSPVVVGWLPDDLRATGAEVIGDSPTTWRSVVYLGAPVPDSSSAPVGKDKAQMPEPREGSVSLASFTDAPAGGEQFTLGGHPARYVTRANSPRPQPFVVVDLGGGRLLTVVGTSSLQRDELVRIAERVEVQAQPDVAWLGK